MNNQLELDDDQIIEIVGYDFGLTRRTFVQIVGAGLLIGVAMGETLGQDRRGGSGRGGFGGDRSPAPLDARLQINKDGTVTVMTGKVEGGQGARTQIQQAAAEELGLSVEKVQMLLADTDLVPDDGITAGSRTTPSTLPAVRGACADARRMLQEFAKGDASKTYADLAAADPAALRRAAVQGADVIEPREWKVLGKSIPRSNTRDIVTGAHHYPADVIRPGMLYGKILRAPAYGAKLTTTDVEKAKSIDGVVVVRDGSFIGVAAPTTHAAKQAIKRLEESASWEKSPQVSSAKLYEHLRAHAKVPPNPFASEISAAAKTLKRTFHVPYIQHCPMEPRVAVAEWDENGKVTIWTSTQNPFGVRREVAGAFHIEPEKVRVIVPDFGGGFGGKHTGETAVEAARLAKSAGKPVALRWTRAEELTWATFRPAAVIDIEASLSSDGRITSWHMVSINPGRAGVQSPYDIAKNESQAVDSAPPLRHGSYRALATTAHNFARESMMDDLAAAAGADPLQFRLDHLEEGRLRDVLQAAAEKSNWSERRGKARDTTTGIGLACGTDKGGFVAACAEVEVNPARKTFKIVRITQAFECGAITSPDNLHSQNIGAIIQGLGPVLSEAMQFEDGRITNASFWKYEVPRMSDVPKIEVHVLNRPDLPPAGAGETPLVAVAPAIRNAILDATKQALTELPLRLSGP